MGARGMILHSILVVRCRIIPTGSIPAFLVLLGHDLHRQVAGQQDIQHRREGCIRLAVGIQIDPVVDIRQVVVDILGLRFYFRD